MTDLATSRAARDDATSGAAARRATTPAAELHGPRGTLPHVVAVAVVRDEEPYLATAVEAVLDQTWAGPLDVVLAVGPSRDRTREIAEEFAARDPRVHVVDNPTGSRSEGLNLAVERAAAMPGSDDGDVVVRFDGHAVLPVGYVRHAVRVMGRTGADVVGGMMVPVGRTPFQRAVARAMAHPAGIGATSFHTGGEAGPAHTVYLGVFRRTALERVGGYDPTLVRAEDWDLNRRIRADGGVVWFDPELQVVYRPRSTARDLARQFWRTGMWRREIVRRHPTTASPRYLAPPALVLGLVASLVLGLVGLVDALVPPAPTAWLGLALFAPVSYLLVVLTASAHAGLRQPRAVKVRLPVVLVVMHVAWGVGFLRGVSRHARTEHRT
ncbi:glycosyltransferase family 2 protein [Luteimicrobium sp. NPDC057192]|uniref:glycosyltransferase family 2 protein n=1 Tax=Luteimicrobium sp. NPDC057192 TaxID=3346042 RepID=UPI00362F996E